jgi:hypothetical protein
MGATLRVMLYPNRHQEWGMERRAWDDVLDYVWMIE